MKTFTQKSILNFKITMIGYTEESPPFIQFSYAGFGLIMATYDKETYKVNGYEIVHYDERHKFKQTISFDDIVSYCQEIFGHTIFRSLTLNQCLFIMKHFELAPVDYPFKK